MQAIITSREKPVAERGDGVENTGYDVDDGVLYIGTKRMCLMVFAKDEANRG